MHITALTPDDWRLLRALRIAAVTDTPTAFSTTAEAEAAKTDEEWQQLARTRTTPGQSAHFIARDDTSPDPLGQAAVYLDKTDPTRAHLVSVWTAPAGRGRGIARALLTHAIAWARTHGCTIITLDVTRGNSKAEALYASLHFLPTGNFHTHKVFPELVMDELALTL
jgi:ribosomal protein S18 acetylase RimI-like enzyme